MAIGAVVAGLATVGSALIGRNSARKAADEAAERAALQPFRVSGPGGFGNIDPQNGTINFGGSQQTQQLANQALRLQQGLFFGDIARPGAPIGGANGGGGRGLRKPTPPTKPTNQSSTAELLSQWERMNPRPSEFQIKAGRRFGDNFTGDDLNREMGVAIQNWERQRQTIKLQDEARQKQIKTENNRTNAQYQRELQKYQQDLKRYNTQVAQQKKNAQQAGKTTGGGSPQNVTGGSAPNSGGTAGGLLGGATNRPAGGITAPGQGSPLGGQGDGLDISGLFSGLDPRQEAQRDVFGATALEASKFLDFNPETAAQTEFDLRMKLLNPEFKRQQVALDDKLFGRGLSGATAGFGAQRRLYGAQGDLTNQAAVESIGSARNERNTLFGQFMTALSGQAGLNELNRSLQSGERDLALRSGLFGLQSGALNQYLQLSHGVPLDYANLALQASGAGANAGANAAQFINQQGQSDLGLYSSIGSSVGNAIGGLFGGGGGGGFSAPGTPSNFTNYGQSFGLFG